MTGRILIIVCLVLAGCNDAKTSSGSQAPQAANKPTETSGYLSLNEAVAAALANPDGMFADFESTLAYIEEDENHWYMQDLNGDGVEEAICYANRYAYGPDERGNPCGATGNCPGYVFQKINGRWHLIIEEQWGKGFDVSETKVNGWAVLTQSSRMSISDYPTNVYVFQDGRYRIAHTYDGSPQEVHE